MDGYVYCNGPDMTARLAGNTTPRYAGRFKERSPDRRRFF